ncbi:MAG: hypothetical protein GY765_30875 [bacterium]|nr:hypothetical protein [bacterium]
MTPAELEQFLNEVLEKEGENIMKQCAIKLPGGAIVFKIEQDAAESIIRLINRLPENK